MYRTADSNYSGFTSHSKKGFTSQFLFRKLVWDKLKSNFKCPIVKIKEKSENKGILISTIGRVSKLPKSFVYLRRFVKVQLI